MISLGLLPRNTKQWQPHIAPPTRYAAGKAWFLPCAHNCLVPAFPPGLELGLGLPRRGFLAAALAAPTTWHWGHSSCIAVSHHSRWLGRQFFCQVIG
jgi:hypothetical protein